MDMVLVLFHEVLMAMDSKTVNTNLEWQYLARFFDPLDACG
jgi:hypothetical protein